jgi:hypothetical protein
MHNLQASPTARVLYMGILPLGPVVISPKAPSYPWVLYMGISIISQKKKKKKKKKKYIYIYGFL